VDTRRLLLLSWIIAFALGPMVPGSRAGAQAVANPHEAGVGACATCHLPDAWRPARIGKEFRHAEQTFPLDGAHNTAKCAACHLSLDFSKARPDCVACHQDVHRGELGLNCSRCHTTRSFIDQARLIRLHEQTRFPLQGVHLATPCESCHPGTLAGQPQYFGRPSTCVACHRPDYDRTTAPAHVAAGYSMDCTGCHTSAAATWQGAVFNHNASLFPLTGAHLAVACTVCHGDGVFRGKPTACVSCHQAPYTATTTPPHAAAGFATACASCHNTTTWLTATWDHTSTGWALTGIHVTTPCASCHGDGVYHGKSILCYGCHTTEYNTTNNPSHTAASFPTNCESCHTTTTWLGATFNHDASFFPIYSGSHNNRWTACSDCHASPSDFSVYTCTTSCHPQSVMDPRHNGRSGYQYLSSACYHCHPRGSSG
jgi:hypothetical protein